MPPVGHPIEKALDGRCRYRHLIEIKRRLAQSAKVAMRTHRTWRNAMKVLLSYDGSECSDRAVKFVATTLRKQTPDLKLDVIYVDMPMLDRVVATLGEETVARLHRENADLVLK